MTVAHHELRDTRDKTLDLIGLNHAQRHLLANTTPERDSVLEHLQYWRTKYAITDQDWIACGLDLGKAITLNDQEYVGERQIAGTLDDLASVAHRHAARPMSIKELANRLRGALNVLAVPAGHNADDLIASRRIVSDVVGVTPRDRLLSDSLRHELRPTAHDQLVEFIGSAVRS